MKKTVFTAIIAFLLGAGMTYVTAEEKRGPDLQTLKIIEEKGGTAFEEVAAISRILAKNPNMVHFNDSS